MSDPVHRHESSSGHSGSSLAPIEGRRLLLDTVSVSVLGCVHDMSEPVIQAWNGVRI